MTTLKGLLELVEARRGHFELESGHGIAVQAAAHDDFEMWPPSECPLCVAGLPLEKAPAA